MNKIKILVAEDNKINQLLMKIIFGNNNYDFVIVENGLLACEELKNKPNFYSVILMDLMMPVMDGLDATEEIRKNINDEIPIIAVTGDVSENIKEKCLNTGMNDYIAKPYESSELINIITKNIKQ